MNFKAPRSLAIAATISMLATAAYAAPISGVTTISSIGTFFTYNLSDLTNGDGLSVVGSTAATHSNQFNTMWMGDNGNTTGSLVFDLGSVYSLGSVDLWNYNANCCGLDRGVQNFSLEISTDGLSYASLLGSSTLAQATGTSAQASEQFSLGGATGQYVRLNIASNYGGSYVGLSEVLFSSGVAPVPVPASLPLLALGLGGLGVAARRKRKAA